MDGEGGPCTPEPQRHIPRVAGGCQVPLGVPCDASFWSLLRAPLCGPRGLHRLSGPSEPSTMTGDGSHMKSPYIETPRGGLNKSLLTLTALFGTGKVLAKPCLRDIQPASSRYSLSSGSRDGASLLPSPLRAHRLVKQDERRSSGISRQLRSSGYSYLPCSCYFVRN